MTTIIRCRSEKSTLLPLLNRLSDLIDGTERRGTVMLAGRDIFAPEISVGERIIYLETGTLEEINVDTK